MHRRTFMAALGAVGAAATASGIAARRSVASGGEAAWSNWSGLQTAPTATIAEPRSTPALARLMRESPGPIRPVGSGHSFTGLVPTDGTIVRPDAFGGVIGVDPRAGTATLGAGGRLRDLSPALAERGLAFRNLGDINVQSLAGAAGTATHGTGKTMPCLAAEIVAATLVTPSGDIVRADIETEPDLLRAFQVSLGTLGVMTEATVSVVPSYDLHRRTWTAPISEVLSEAHDRWDRHRNYEFFYIPFSDHAYCVSHDLTEAPRTPRAASEDADGLRDLERARNYLGWHEGLRRRAISSAVADTMGEDVVGESWQLLASERERTFNEMEYHLPPETALETLQAVIGLVESDHPETFFPIEVRQTAGDDGMLSPFQGGRRISIAVHAAADDHHGWFYSEVEPIFRRAGGRPHWGKLHSLGPNELGDLYPEFEAFRTVRRELDPKGKMLNPYLAKLFGERPSA